MTLRTRRCDFKGLCHALIAVLAVSPAAIADEKVPPPVRSASQAVRNGNERLRQGDAEGALQQYDEAEKLKPDAKEIAFDQGLSYFKLGRFDEARQSFEEAAESENDELSADALYGAAAVDHAQAFAESGQPRQALSKLESAMQKYQDLLARRPDHPLSRDANYKAASLWREIKRQLEQQQQQSSDQKEQNNDEKKERQSSSEEQKESDEQQEQNQGESSQQREQQEKQNQEKQSQDQQSQEQDQEQKSESSESKESEEQSAQEQKPSAAEQEEQVSREQAERKLREMMQAIRDRKKNRREEPQKVPVSRVEKDW